VGRARDAVVALERGLDRRVAPRRQRRSRERLGALYFHGEDKYITMCLVDQATSACPETFNLAELQRGHWHDFVMHREAVFGPEDRLSRDLDRRRQRAAEAHDVEQVPGMKNYLLIGRYRNAHIGDPNMLYPDGTHVFGTDGTPGVAYVDGFIAGKTKESVWPADPTPAPAPAPDPTPVPQPTTQAPDPGDSSSPPAPTSTPGTTPTANAAVGFPQGGGCSSTGFQSAWLALPLVGFFVLRRRRLAA
jgi:hypothetical protein